MLCLVSVVYVYVVEEVCSEVLSVCTAPHVPDPPTRPTPTLVEVRAIPSYHIHRQRKERGAAPSEHVFCAAVVCCMLKCVLLCLVCCIMCRRV